MSRFRTAIAAVTIGCAVMLAGAATASAQDRVPLTQKVAVTGKNKGKDFKGIYTIQRFTTRGGNLVAVGRLTGTLKNRRVSRDNVRMPASVAEAPAAQNSQLPPAPQPLPVPSCPVLALDLGAIKLNLLGLVVRTNRIFLNIDGIPSSETGGGLLGDIVCALSSVVLPPTPASQGAAPLSAITALSPRNP
jgi:hypothetical protein